MGEEAVYTVSLSEPLWWQKIGKVANQTKLAVPSHSEPLLWEKDDQSCKSDEIGCSKPLQWEKIGKVAKLNIIQK